MKNRIKKYISIVACCGILSTACSDQDNLGVTESLYTGTIIFQMALPNTSTALTSQPGSIDDIVDYPQDYDIRQVNAYLFDGSGNLSMSYENIASGITKENPVANITLENVPTGNNQTLLCVANPNLFPGLSNLSEHVTLKEVTALTTNPISNNNAEADIFMISSNSLNVNNGSTTRISGTLARGVGRLDIFSIDEQIRVDSVAIINAATKSHLMTKSDAEISTISLKKNVTDFVKRAKIAYLNEASSKTEIAIYLTRNGIQGIANVDIPTLERNNIYTVNLETLNGSHQVTGELIIKPWDHNIIDGTVSSDLILDKDATLQSFSTPGGGTPRMINDTTLLVSGHRSYGLLCFKDGAELTATLMAEQDTTMITINRNAVTRGTINTHFDLTVKTFQDTNVSNTREAKLWVSNLLTGKGKTFIIRQQAAGYIEMNVPLLNFENSHQFTKDLVLTGVTQASELSIPFDRDFRISVSKLADNSYRFTVTKQRIYEIVPLGKQLVINHAGTKKVILNFTPDKGFVYNEVQMGELIFMDRDLGAKDASHTGEIFVVGSLLPIDQTGFNSDFSGQGRPSGSSISQNYTTKWFTTSSSGEKNTEIDPCPEGWHTASYSDLLQIFSDTKGTTTNPVTGQGELNTSVEFIDNNNHINVTFSGKSLTFDYSSGCFSSNRIVRDVNWPCGWWSSTKNDNHRPYHLSFKVKSPYSIAPRIHDLSVNKTGLNIRCVKDNSTQVPQKIPSVQLGGKEWMSFNSTGKGNTGQLMCKSWESVETLYKDEWTDRLGMLFQWGRKYAHNQWTTYSNNPGSETNTYLKWNNKPAQVPCPDGYRIPTRQELRDLLPNRELPTEATYLYGGERIRASLHDANPPTVSGWHGYSGRARYLKLTSLETGNYLIFPLAGGKADKSSSTDPNLGTRFRLWTDDVTGLPAYSGRASDIKYEPGSRDIATPIFEDTRPKEAYDYVRCIKK